MNPQVSHPASRGSFPEPNSSLYVLKRAKRTNLSLMGNVIPLDQIRALIDLTPCFGDVAKRTLTFQNSTIYNSEYFVNKYFDKELFWALKT